MNQDPKNYTHKILSVFSHVKHPGNSNLLRLDGFDDSDVIFLHKYENKSWEDINQDELDVECSCLSALSDAGLKYVIPAYLLKYLTNPKIDNFGWIDRLLRVLAECGRGKLNFSRSEFQLIDEIFLQPIQDEWNNTTDPIRCIGMFGENRLSCISDARSHWVV